MEVNCKGCQKPIEKGNSRKVGDCFFCIDCFEELLDESKKKREPEPPEVGMDIAIKFESTRCHVCTKPLTKNFKTLGDWKFCPDCYADMMPPAPPKPKQKKPKPPESKPAAPFQPEPVRVPVERVCKGCSRRVVEGGYKEISDDPFCPDCYYALLDMVGDKPREKSQSPGKVEARPLSTMPVKKSQAPAPENASAMFLCQSCASTVPEGTLKMIEGFAICQACLATDIETALKIARGRHKMRLKQLREEFAE